MKRFLSVQTISVAVAVWAFGCNSKTPVMSSAPSATGSARDAPIASASQRSEIAPLDPQIAGLAAPVLACKIKDQRFVECPAAEEFRNSRAAAFEGEKGDAALLALIVHPELRYRMLAASRNLDDPARLLATKANAETVLAQLERETDSAVRDELASWAGNIDVQKLGLTERLKAIASNKDAKVRRSIAYRLLFHHQKNKSVGYEIVGPMLADGDREVRRSAAIGLSNDAAFAATPACKLLADAFDGPYGDDVVWHAASAGHCPGSQEKALSFLEKKIASPADITNDVGIDYALALQSVCSDPKKRGVKELPSPSASVRKRAFDAGARLASKEVRDANTRRAALSSLTACDPARARSELQKLSKDADSFIADEAKEKLAKR